ncbi:MAG: hypothetical protein KatS3mg123_1545 [Burkholderiales bacterium]|nr:MAG: hypothetical protein KatS3mg123_1545 [Burkholderiales bacterium]
MRLGSILLFILFFSVSGGASAQRILPAEAALGKVDAFEYPHAKIAGKTYRLAPGARIFDSWNRVVMPPALPQDARVLYLVDGNGDLSRVWLLTPEELAREELKRRR